jgi:hypothetical protein
VSLAVSGAAINMHPMTALFKKPKVNIPQAADPAPVPTIDQATQNRNETQRARRRRGLVGNVVAGGLGLTVGSQNAAPKQLTGQ